MFKTPANAAPLNDKREIDARYRYWRRHILITIWLGYALFYFTRKSFNAAAPEILASGVMTRTDIGLLATLFYITYGLSKFFSGIVSDRSNARYFMGSGLIATGVVNILFGFSTSLWAFALLWALNAFFQGWARRCVPVCSPPGTRATSVAAGGLSGTRRITSGGRLFRWWSGRRRCTTAGARE